MKKEVLAVAGVLFLFPLFVFANLVLDGSTSYDSRNINVTQEIGFAHLNISDPDLVLYLPFDVQENSLNITSDYTNNSYNATLYNGPLFNSSGGKYGGAYDFDANLSNRYLKINGNLGLNQTNFSGFAWINPVSYGYYFNEQDILGEGPSTWEFGMKSDDELKFYYNSNTSCYVSSTTFNIPLNNWAFVGFTYNAGNITLYYNTNSVSFDRTTCDSPVSLVNFYVGFRSVGGVEYFNGSIDEVAVFNRSLNSDEVSQIYNSTYSRFYPNGEMLFQNNNLGTNNTVNISLESCQTINGSYLQAKINSGSYVNFSNCNITNYNAEGNLTSANLTLKLITGDNYFYSPLVIDNITLYSLDNISSIVTISSPTNGSTSASSNVSISVVTNENSTCNYSTNSGAANSSLTANSTGTGHTGTASSLSNGDYTLNVYCSDLQGNTNNTQNISFTVAVPSSSTINTSTDGSSGRGTYKPSQDSLAKGYTANVVGGQKVLVSFDGGLSGIVEIKSVSDDKVVVNFEGEEYEITISTSGKIDLDNDGVYDVEISSSKIYSNGVAKLEFKLISEKVPSEVQEEQQEENIVGEEISEKIGFWKKFGSFFSRIWDWITFWN